MNIALPTENCWKIYMLGRWEYDDCNFPQRCITNFFRLEVGRCTIEQSSHFLTESILLTCTHVGRAKTPISIWICHTSLYPTFRACVFHVCACRGVHRPRDPYLLQHPLQYKVQLPNATMVDKSELWAKFQNNWKWKWGNEMRNWNSVISCIFWDKRTALCIQF